MRIITIIFLFISSLAAANKPYPVIIDHDGGIDDLLATAFITTQANIKTKAIIVTPADSWLTPAVDATRRLIRLMHLKNIPMHPSGNAGINKFPVAWRNDAYKILSIPALLPDRELEKDDIYNKIPAKEILITLLSGKQKYDLLVTGPLSNIADALSESPKIAKQIHRLYFMGGAFEVIGNVDLKDKPKQAEWNVYNNPKALETVLSYQVPIIFVPLDATNKAPVTRHFIQKLKAQSHFPLSKIASELYLLVDQQIEPADYQKQYFFWDLLTAVALVDKSAFKIKPIKLLVELQGANEGKTKLSSKGYPAEMVYDVDINKVESLLLSAFRYS